MLVRIKPCVNLNSYGSAFGTWARSFTGKTFDVTRYDIGGYFHFIPSDMNTMLDPYDHRYFLQKELIFIKEKK